MGSAQQEAADLSAMEVGERGYLVERSSWGGSRGQITWLKQPLYEYVGSQPGNSVTFYLFRSVAGRHTISVTNVDIEIGEYVFCNAPQMPRKKVRKPKSKSWDMQAGSQFSICLNSGGRKL